jgi:hypothetical protein
MIISEHNCFGQCDVCAENHRILHGWQVCGLETWACTICSYGDPSEDIYDLEDEIEALQAMPALGDDNEEYLKHLKVALHNARNSTNEHASHGSADNHGAQPLQS